MRTAAYKVDVASDRRRRENVSRHILCSLCEKLAKCAFRSCSALQEIMVIVIGKNAQPIRTSCMSVTGFYI